LIVGLLCRHYKIYQGLNFIPICDDYQNPFTLFIGNNAVGKSSVLESLNTFFNNAHWNHTKNTKADEAFIAPIFLINKNDIKDNIKKEYYDLLILLSDYFWNVTEEANGNLKNNVFRKFFEFRDELKYRYGQEDFLFFTLGISMQEKSKVYYSTFTKDLEKKLESSGMDCRDIGLINNIKSYYSYIYVPVESITSEVIKIENREMQDLMSTDILEEIDHILNEKSFSSKNGNGRIKKISLMDYLNHNLDEYMNKINDTIGKIDPSYAYKVEHGYKKNLTPSDVRNRILEAYFSIRTLKKDKKEIYELSSGEQRIALIDIATAFLQNNTKYNKRKIILAIDEPENSLHISKAFGQFERLQSLVGENQLILTTHWYGSLPITSLGNVQHVELKEDNKININTYDLNNYFEKRGSLPEDIQMKSYFDLTASILSSIRADKNHWIICEGSDDKLYLSHYLSEVKNLKLLSVGGCGNVIKIYRYLFTPFLEKDEKKAIESKVLCLIDTDDIVHDLEISSDVKGKLKLARIQPDREGNIKLQSVSKSGYFQPTEMEDCLNPKKYYESVKEVIFKSGNKNLIEVFNKFKFKEDSMSSRIKSEEFSILEPMELVTFAEKKRIYDFLDNNYNKFLIAKNYTSRERGDLPVLFRLIKDYFETN